MNKDDFQARFGDDPRRDDLTLLNPKQDDPTEQVNLTSVWDFLLLRSLLSKMVIHLSTRAFHQQGSFPNKK